MKIHASSETMNIEINPNRIGLQVEPVWAAALSMEHIDNPMRNTLSKIGVEKYENDNDFMAEIAEGKNKSSIAEETDYIYVECTQDLQGQIEESLVNMLQRINNSASNGVKPPSFRFLEMNETKLLSREAADNVLLRCLKRLVRSDTSMNAIVMQIESRPSFICLVSASIKKHVDSSSGR